MQIKTTLLSGLLIIFCSALEAQTAHLTLHISQVRVIEQSMLRIAVYNSEESYFEEEQMFKSAEIRVDSSVIEYIFPDLPAGTYAITIYHDEDNDGEMDRKWYGPPKEGYAFSNNFHSSIRPASFKDASFELSGDTLLEIQMRY